MFEKEIRGGICYSIHRYAKANNKYLKNHDKNIEPSYLMCSDLNNLYGWDMPQKVYVDDFKWEMNISKFDKKVIKNYDEDSNKGCILEVDVIQKIYIIK